MPKNDKNIILVDEEGRETVTKFLAKRHGLSAGWRGFVRDHGLLEEDILVFRMVATAPYKLKVSKNTVLHVCIREVLTICFLRTI